MSDTGEGARLWTGQGSFAYYLAEIATLTA